MGRDAVCGNRDRADGEGQRLHLRLGSRCERCSRYGDGEKAAETTHRGMVAPSPGTPRPAGDAYRGKELARGTLASVSWQWIVLLAIGIGVVVAAEWPRFERLAGADARRLRDREKRKGKLRVVSTDDDEFVRSVQADLEALPTIEERETNR